MEGLDRPYLPYLALALAVLIAFGGVVTASFHLDDYAIFSDPVLTSSSGWWQVWRPMQTRPLTYFTYWVNYQLGGENPVGYHVLNLAIHLAAVLLLYGTLRRIVPVKAALIAAAIFGLHPIQSEPIAYIYARGTLLMTLAAIGSLALWVRGRRWWAVAAFAVALLAKEECVAFPLVLLLWHIAAKRDRAERPAIAAMLALSLAAGLRVMAVAAMIPGSGSGGGAEVGPLQYFVAQGVSIVRYFQLLVFPWGFTIDPEITIHSPWQPALGWLLIAFIAVECSTRLRKMGPAFWLLVGIVLLLPSSSIFPANDLAADRRLYLPLIGFATGAGLLLQRFRKEAVLAVCAVLAVLSIARVQVWQTEQSLWQEAVERSPGKVRPRIQLSRAVGTAEAIVLLTQTEEMAPNNALVATELGRRYLDAGRPDEALGAFGRALALDPGSATALNNRGVALSRIGQNNIALQDFEHALAADPCLFDARYNLRQLGIPLPRPPADCRYTAQQRRMLGIEP